MLLTIKALKRILTKELKGHRSVLKFIASPEGFRILNKKILIISAFVIVVSIENQVELFKQTNIGLPLDQL